MTLWVCIDCVDAAEGNDNGFRPDRVPWNLIEGNATPGLVWSEHFDPAGCEAAVGNGERCACETISFSKYPCDACGSLLAGTREAYTVM